MSEFPLQYLKEGQTQHNKISEGNRTSVAINKKKIECIGVVNKPYENLLVRPSHQMTGVI